MAGSTKHTMKIVSLLQKIISHIPSERAIFFIKIICPKHKTPLWSRQEHSVGECPSTESCFKSSEKIKIPCKTCSKQDYE